MGIEHHLCNNVVKVNREITKLVSSMLENSENDDQVMKSVYQIAHQKGTVIGIVLTLFTLTWVFILQLTPLTL